MIRGSLNKPSHGKGDIAKMKYRRVGNSGLKISEIGLGSWLTYGTAYEQQAADACIGTAFECGINFFDTSNAYNRGEGARCGA